jgi:hypothetical protein
MKTYYYKELDNNIWKEFRADKFDPFNKEHGEILSYRRNGLLNYLFALIGYSKELDIPLTKLVDLMLKGTVSIIGWGDETRYLGLIQPFLNMEFEEFDI